jgi:hypothetical protein
MRELWIHSAVEQLQHLIVRRTIRNGVSREEILRQWITIQKDMNKAIQEMDKEYAGSVDALPPQEKARNQPLVGDNKLR